MKNEGPLVEKYEEAPDVLDWIKRVMDKSGDKFFNLVRFAKVGAIFRNIEKTKNNKTVLGSARKVSEVNRVFINYDYIIEIWSSFWSSASDLEKEALIFHELSHCVVEESYDKEEHLKLKFKVVPHDFEGFVDEYEKYGNWRNDLPDFDTSRDSNAEDEDLATEEYF